MKHLPLTAVLLSAAFFVSCASAPRSTVAEKRNIPVDFAGLVHAGSTNTPEEYAYLDYMGVSWVLQTFYWSRIEPAQGEWDFSDYDTLVDNAQAAGIKVLGVLAYDNGWIHKDNKRHNYIPPERLPDFLEYVRVTVGHFQGRVGAWCIWNEPNFHFWTGTVDEYVELALQTAEAVREIDGEVVLLGGAFNRGVFGLPQKYIRRLFESGAMEKTDAVAFHPYELNPARTARLYDQFKKIADGYGFGDKIWITEVGYPTGGWYPTRVSEQKFPAYIIKTFVLLAAKGGNKIFWYQLFDPAAREKGNSEDFFGLVRSREDYTSKGAEAFR
ncbi:MAG: beta-galactosidase, partial [Treponema sp.]|nr:beta-galactosidase [Treponema sp.]